MRECSYGNIPKETCPYCGFECEAEWVDVDIGLVKCGPYYCENCGAYEIGYEIRKYLAINAEDEQICAIRGKYTTFTDKELETGWREPKIVGHVNTVDITKAKTNQ